MNQEAAITNTTGKRLLSIIKTQKKVSPNKEGISTLLNNSQKRYKYLKNTFKVYLTSNLKDMNESKVSFIYHTLIYSINVC